MRPDADVYAYVQDLEKHLQLTLFGGGVADPEGAVLLVRGALADGDRDRAAALARQTQQLAMTATWAGGRVVLGGIPDDDTTTFRAAVARRKGLTIAMVRRMNEVYPRAIALAAGHKVDLTSLPWSHMETTTLTVVSGSISAQVHGGQVGCRMLVNGVVRDEQSATREDADVTCRVKSA